ncbi:MAG: SPOR domain-containing protein [Melioribacteraceae bacterium]|jgi:hypothetical protein|nr:SPOR domain-containing protein [Melioribacteraceae bacterium]
MRQKLKIYLLIIVLINFNSLLSQDLTDNWKLIKTDDISNLFIDPLKIVEYGNEISVWAFERLMKPRVLEKNEKIFSIKTHYLFNKMKKRYAEIGIIYYDAKGGIVNRSSKSNLNSGPSAFMMPISANINTEIVYKEVISYLITGDLSEVEEINNNEIEKLIVRTEPENIKDNEKTINLKPNANDIDMVSDKNITINNNSIKSVTAKDISSSEKVNLSKESWNEIPKIEERLELAEKPSFVPISKSKEFDKIIIDDSINIDNSKQKYNLSNERALKNAIFTDGNLYCFQVSSWKTKSYADREVNKLTSKGYKSYLVSVKPKHKNSIWHRVRVGYFSSLQEAKETQREAKRK